MWYVAVYLKIMTRKEHNASDVAKYIIYLLSKKYVGDNKEREGVTNLKLQKLLYFGQAYSLAAEGKPLFSDPINAWEYGPVVKTVYYEYKEHKSNTIILEKYAHLSIDKDVQEIVKKVLEIFGGFSAGKLVDIAHAHPPWKNAFDSPEEEKVISKASLKDYYTSLFVTS